MVIIRAEDFASRTLRRVSGEFAAMSRAQQLAARQDALNLRRMQQADKFRKAIERGTSLQAMKQRLDLERQLADVRAKQPRMLVGDPTGDIARWNRAMAAVNTQIGHSDRMLRNLDPTMQRLFTRIKDLPGASRMLDDALAGNARALEQLRLQAGMTARETEALRKAFRQLPFENLDRLGHVMSGIGRTMQLWGAAGVIGIGLAAKTFADFSTDVSLAATQARDLTQNARPLTAVMEQLENGVKGANGEVAGILDLMLKYPSTSKEMTDATYEIFSSMSLARNGVMDLEKGLGLLETANKIAVAGGVELEEATSAMITVFNNFDPKLQKTTETLDTMFDIVRFGRMRLSDFNIMMNKIAPAAAGAGQTLEDVGGAMAFLTEVMPSQRMVATGISRLLEAFQHPDVMKGLRIFGVEIEDVVNGGLLPLDEIMQRIAKRFPALTRGQIGAAEFFRTITAAARGGGRGIFFTQEGRRAFQQMITHMDGFIKRQNEIEVNRDEFNRSFQQQLQTEGVQWQIFTNQLKTLVLIIGKEAIPVFAQIGDTIASIVRWFQELDPRMQGLIVRTLTWASVGSLLAGVLLAVFGAMLSFEAMLRKLLIGGAATSGIMGSLLMILKRLAVIGAIIITLEVLWGGDPTAQDFLLGAIAGGLAGARFGPAGIVAGAITVPLIIHMVDVIQGPRSDIGKAFREFKANLFGADRETQDQFMGMDLEAFEKRVTRLRKQLGHKIFSPADLAFWRLLPDSVRKGTVEIEKQKSLMDRIRESQQKYIKAMKADQLAVAQKQAEELRQLYEELSGGADEAATAMEDYNERVAQATKDARTEVLGNLRNMYMDMQRVNEQAFGEFMQGPLFSSESWNIAEQWGLTPTIGLITEDLKEQADEFERMRRNIGTLMKRGLPKGLLDEFRKMSAEEANPLLEQLLTAKPGQVQALITQWKRKNRDIQDATKLDFADEIARFKKAGLDMGEAIKMGFQDANVAAWFDNWVQRKFPEVINSAVAAAIRKWKLENPAPKVPATTTAPKNAQAAAQQGTTPKGNTTQDNSKNVTVNMQPPYPVQPAGNSYLTQAEYKKVAFALTNTLKEFVN